MARQSAFAVTLLLLFSCTNGTLAGWESSDVSEQQERAMDELKKVYKMKLQPLEEAFWFERFYEFKEMDFAEYDFATKPIILLLGEHSTGKTTFIRYLLGSDFEGMAVGAEVMTDNFIPVMYGKRKEKIPGNLLVQDKKLPFKNLRKLGTKFLQHFYASKLPNPVLKSITLIDTPSIVPDNDDKKRDYDYTSVVSVLIEQADMILLFFDAQKMYIVSDECERVINLIKLQKSRRKMYVVLNKADTIPTNDLVRVYGVLMWGLGRVFATTELSLVYIGSFCDKSNVSHENHALFRQGRDTLFNKMQRLSHLNAMNKVDRMIERAYQARTHAHILCHLRSKMPNWYGQEDTQKGLIHNLEKEFEEIQVKSKYQHDFPDVKTMQGQLRKYNLMDFPTCDEAKGQFRAADSMLSEDMLEIVQLAEQKVNERNTMKGPYNAKHSEL